MHTTHSSELALKCTRAQESASYNDRESYFEAASHFAKVGKAGALPMHFIFGEINDTV